MIVLVLALVRLLLRAIVLCLYCVLVCMLKLIRRTHLILVYMFAPTYYLLLITSNLDLRSYNVVLPNSYALFLVTTF